MDWIELDLKSICKKSLLFRIHLYLLFELNFGSKCSAYCLWL